MADEIDIGRVVELATMLQLAAERQERLATIQEADANLAALLQGVDARTEAIQIAVQTGVPREYAECAMERLYPDVKMIRALESVLHVKQTFDSAVNANVALVTLFLRDLSVELESSFPGLVINAGGPHHWRVQDEKGIFNPVHSIDFTALSAPTLYRRIYTGARGSGEFDYIGIRLDFFSALPKPVIKEKNPRPPPVLTRLFTWLGLQPTLPTSIEIKYDCLAKVDICLAKYFSNRAEAPEGTNFDLNNGNNVITLPKPYLSWVVYQPEILPSIASAVDRHNQKISCEFKKNYV